MSGFSVDWLALREAADHAARNRPLLDLVGATFGKQDQIIVVDLACGSGSNLRGQALHLPRRQYWRLVDHDPDLLAAARRALTDWADHVANVDPLILHKADRRIEIAFERCDLATFDGEALLQGADLVTAAAFFDLVSKDWITSFCAELARRGLPLYAVLSYDGEEKWSPPHAADAAMLAAFHRHQARDKGFGPATGPQAVAILNDAFVALGHQVDIGSSPWRLSRPDSKLIEALADGSAHAIAETGLAPLEEIDKWRRARRGATGCEIGHVDLFARAR